jgi:hypothetical protein
MIAPMSRQPVTLIVNVLHGNGDAAAFDEPVDAVAADRSEGAAEGDREGYGHGELPLY